MPGDSPPFQVPRLVLGGHEYGAREELPTHDRKASMIVNAPPSDRDELEEQQLYRQAMPLLHAHSTATIKTLKKLLPSGSGVSKRMLSRSVEAQFNSTMPGNRGDGKWSRRQLEFVAVCERMIELFSSLEPREASSAPGVARARVRELLAAFDLRVDDAAYRQWEQSLPLSTAFVSARMFVQACRLWFGERFLMEHVSTRLGYDDKGQPSVGLGDPKRGAGGNQLVDHPFSKMARESKVAAAFNYREYADIPPTIAASPSRTEQARCGREHALSASASAPTIPVASSTHLPSRQLPMHRPSLLRPPPAAPPKESERQRRLRGKRERARDTEMARAFSASVAMISRHVQNEEMRDARDALRERQLAKTDEQRLWNQEHRAHCQARVDDHAQQQRQQVAAMKALALEEQQLMRESAAMRQELLRRRRLEQQPFALSASTSTVFQQPPELLAARATAKTAAERKRLRVVEREHLKHMRSLQLLDYVVDKKHAALEALKPKADAALVNVGDEGQRDELPLAEAVTRDELWRELLQQEAAAGGDFAAFVPPANSPPAALRFFGASRPLALPPFASSAPRELT